eukprot:IDg19034t1
MHAAMRLAARLSPASTLAYVRLLRDAGASFEARDVYGCTPLHELVITLAVSRRARALEGTRVHRPSLRRVQSTIEFALLEGADLFAVDRRGVTPFDIAVREHLDYLVLVRAAHFIYTNICKNSQREAMDGRMGMFEALPHDIILRIVSCLSPRDAVTGIGASCKALNELYYATELDQAAKGICEHNVDCGVEFVSGLSRLPARPLPLLRTKLGAKGTDA